jgi:hypothetical protein
VAGVALQVTEAAQGEPLGCPVAGAALDLQCMPQAVQRYVGVTELAVGVAKVVEADALLVWVGGCRNSGTASR